MYKVIFSTLAMGGMLKFAGHYKISGGFDVQKQAGEFNKDNIKDA